MDIQVQEERLLKHFGPLGWRIHLHFWADHLLLVSLKDYLLSQTPDPPGRHSTEPSHPLCHGRRSAQISGLHVPSHSPVR